VPEESEEVEIVGELAGVVAGAVAAPPEESLAPTAAHPHRITFRKNAASRKPNPNGLGANVIWRFFDPLDKCRRLRVFTSRAPFEARV
jgi:hypothetical protein